MKRSVYWSVLLCLCCILLTGCGEKTVTQSQISTQSVPLPQPESTSGTNGDYGLRAAILRGSAADSGWEDTLDYFQQSLLIGLEAEVLNVTQGMELSGYDLVIPDAALAQSEDMPQLAETLAAYTQAGGYVLLDNAFAQVLPLDYLGASALSKVEGCPVELTFPELGADLAAVQEVVADYASLYPDFFEYETLVQQDYGYGVIPDSAVTLASLGEVSLYTYNAYGEGGVLLTNPLLPNVYSLGAFSMTHSEQEQTAFSSTTASCNQLLYNRFAAYVAKQNYGYALNRVFGYYGSPSMSWELHYEEITGFANNSMRIFSDLCREYRQIPSFTLIRSSYWWFLRTETVTYLLNQSTGGGLEYAMDYEESAYSSGTHIASGGEWLHLGSIENAGSYFREYPHHNYRAYPCFGDVNGDGTAELLSGSYDGCFYLYENQGYSDRLHVSEAIRVTDPEGYVLQVNGYSAPQLIDIDMDGVLDLVSGDSTGCVSWFRGHGDGSFTGMGVLLQTDISGQVLPGFGDVNGDGIPDLALGSSERILLLYYGTVENGRLTYGWQAMESYSKLCSNEALGDWLAPCLQDLNGDGCLDLAVGTFDGYIAALLGDGSGRLAFEGYITIEEMNYKGNHRVKFGNYCVPAFFDVNGDGGVDLVCGSLEYGLAYPIDSPYFPYRAELEEQVAYAQRNHYYVGVHNYTNGFASPQRERYEMQRHLEAFADYGLTTENIGVNAHTWYTSVLGDTQTLDVQYETGMLWNSGFSSPGDTGVSPQTAAENVIALPFFLEKDDMRSILVQNNSVLPYADAAWSDISAKYAMPISVYYHCDFVYENDAGARGYLQKVSDFQWKYGYNFVREDQQMYASAAAYNLDVTVAFQSGSLQLTPSARATDFAMYDADVQNAVGLEISFAEGCSAADYSVDADVWYRKGNSIFVGMNRSVTLTQAVQTETPHLERVNLAAEITLLDNGAEIVFLEDGMLQAVVDGKAVTSSIGWETEQQNGKTVFTKYGGADTLQIRYTKEDQ